MSPARSTYRLAVMLAAIAGGTFASALPPVWADGVGTASSGPSPSVVFPVGVPGVRGGVVTTSEPAAARVGAHVLRQGGNAIDAAAAVQFALNVVEPQSSGIGGGGFMMIYLADRKEIVIVDSRETAPAAAAPDMFASQPSFTIRSTSGYAVGVPGTVRGVTTALDRWGTISLAAALHPAMRLAENGFPVSRRLESSIASARLSHEPDNPAYDEARSVFRPEGVALRAGTRLRQPGLAGTLRRIAEEGPDAFYRGVIAQAIVDTQRQTRTSNPGGVGRMTLQDLARYRVVIRSPIEGFYREFRIASMPPPSSGGVTVMQILKMMERFPIGEFGFGSAPALHVFIEASRLAFADRARWMGDTDFVTLPTAGLLSDAYLKPRSARISLDRALSGDEVTAGDPRAPGASRVNAGWLPSMVHLADEEGRNTTHFTVADRLGNIVSYTSTIESAWGTGLMVPGFGFMLNNELTDFNREPTFNPAPDRYDPGANDVAPGKRPRSSMAPTMLFLGDKPVAAFGSPGGSSIISTVAQMVSNLIDHRLTVQEAVDAPRLRQTTVNTAAGRTRLESGFSPSAIHRLTALGHSFQAPEVIGSVQAVVIGRDGLQYGAADRRRIGAVVSLRRMEIATPPLPVVPSDGNEVHR